MIRDMGKVILQCVFLRAGMEAGSKVETPKAEALKTEAPKSEECPALRFIKSLTGNIIQCPSGHGPSKTASPQQMSRY